MPEEAGGLDVLNIGAGHLKFNFDKSRPEEVKKAKKVLNDMLKRGYMLFAKVDGEQVRLRSFDPERHVGEHAAHPQQPQKCESRPCPHDHAEPVLAPQHALGAKRCQHRGAEGHDEEHRARGAEVLGPRHDGVDQVIERRVPA